jgi:hypothetical protein
MTASALVLVALVSSALPAFATVPSAANSTIPALLKVGGFVSCGPGFTVLAGPPDPTVAYNVVIRDITNAVIPGASVRIDFTGCSDFFICTTEIPGQNFKCPALDGIKGLVGETDAAGQVTFYTVGASNLTGLVAPPAIAPGAGAGCAQIFANGQFMGFATVAIYNLNGKVAPGGVNGLDFSIAKNEVGAAGLGAPYRGRADYDGSGSVNGADLSILKSIVGCSGLGGCSNQGCPTAYCP